MEDARYSPFLESPTARHWRRLGLHRRAGAAVPLFMVHSRLSAGIGELPDLRLLADWCVRAGLSVLQLLPLNDVGFDFQPYSAQSSFALEPAYLRIDDLAAVESRAAAAAGAALRKAFPAGGPRVNYGVKWAKLDALKELFKRHARRDAESFKAFRRAQSFWLRDYALYKALKDRFGQRGWEEWEEPFRRRDPETLRRAAKEEAETVRFQEWLQWQLFEQFRAAKEHAEVRGVRLMGDIPFLVSRDSADVWIWQDCFKLNLSSGAPPDMFFAKGQRWGMPPYRWERIAERGYDYLARKLAYAENFFDYFRIDHVVGAYRLWTIPLAEPAESYALNGAFDPPDENTWEDHGRRLLLKMIESTRMLPCAEDLGVVPDCSYKVLRELGVPGMDVQRWSRDWKTTKDFTAPADYRPNGMAVLGTHDTALLRGWWAMEAGTIDDGLFVRKCEEKNLPVDDMKARLFDPDRCRHGRLRWKGALRSEDDMLWAAGRPRDELGAIPGMFADSFDEKSRYWRFLGLSGPMEEDPSPRFVRAALEKAGASASVLAIHLLPDWLSVSELWNEDPWLYRVNVPGTTTPDNWSITLPVSLEELMDLPVNDVIRSLNRAAGRR
jgi:4-alpha-glucanotransferase